MFYGEEWVVKNGQKWEFKNSEKPLGCLVWSGNGKINGTGVESMAEFLITPNATVEICADNELCIYVFYPIPQND